MRLDREGQPGGETFAGSTAGQKPGRLVRRGRSEGRRHLPASFPRAAERMGFPAERETMMLRTLCGAYPIRSARFAGLAPPGERLRRHHPNFEIREMQGWKALEAEENLSSDGWRKEQQWALDMGLPGADSITDKSIPTFARGELPHFAGINTFLKAPYVENVRDVGKYDAAVLGIPFDSGTTYRPGTRFGPQGIRRISALYTPYNYELGVDLREQMTLCDAGDVFTIPANLEKSFDQITRGVSHVFSSGALPIMLGGDHSIGFPCVRGIAECTSKRIGIIHFDRHIDIQEKDLDERMHTTPWYWATNLPNVSPKNLVQLGIGGWQVPRYGVEEARKRGTNVLTIADIEKIGLEKTAEIALELAWKDADAVYISFDVDSIDCGFVPGTGWPEPGGFLPREALKILGLVAAEGLCGLEVVEVSPPYDTSDITALFGLRVVVEALGSMVAHGKLGSHKHMIDKPVSY
jgi:agmatinase